MHLVIERFLILNYRWKTQPFSLSEDLYIKDEEKSICNESQALIFLVDKLSFIFSFHESRDITCYKKQLLTKDF